MTVTPHTTSDGSGVLKMVVAATIAVCLIALTLRCAGVGETRDEQSIPVAARRTAIQRGTVIAQSTYSVVSVEDDRASATILSSGGIQRRVRVGDALDGGGFVAAIDADGVTIAREGLRTRLPLTGDKLAPPDTAYKPANPALNATAAGVAQAEKSGRWPAASTANPVPDP